MEVFASVGRSAFFVLVGNYITFHLKSGKGDSTEKRYALWVDIFTRNSRLKHLYKRRNNAHGEALRCCGKNDTVSVKEQNRFNGKYLVMAAMIMNNSGTTTSLALGVKLIINARVSEGELFG